MEVLTRDFLWMLPHAHSSRSHDDDVCGYAIVLAHESPCGGFFIVRLLAEATQVVHNIPPLSLAERRSEGWHLIPAFGDFPKKLAVALRP